MEIICDMQDIETLKEEERKMKKYIDRVKPKL
jgi:hypothetical protein